MRRGGDGGDPEHIACVLEPGLYPGWEQGWEHSPSRLCGVLAAVGFVAGGDQGVGGMGTREETVGRSQGPLGRGGQEGQPPVQDTATVTFVG